MTLDMMHATVSLQGTIASLMGMILFNVDPLLLKNPVTSYFSFLKL
jgi:hypothetical protein